MSVSFQTVRRIGSVVIKNLHKLDSFVQQPDKALDFVICNVIFVFCDTIIQKFESLSRKLPGISDRLIGKSYMHSCKQQYAGSNGCNDYFNNIFVL